MHFGNTIYEMSIQEMLTLRTLASRNERYQINNIPVIQSNISPPDRRVVYQY